MYQLPLLAEPVSAAERLPAPGQKVITWRRDDDGSILGPTIGAPIHADGSHMLNGECIYKPLVAWFPVPELPEHLLEDAG